MSLPRSTASAACLGLLCSELSSMTLRTCPPRCTRAWLQYAHGVTNIARLDTNISHLTCRQ
ncbi:hypothetical protein PSPO01_01195 [Paraphaeosphaeria sporulosa]